MTKIPEQLLETFNTPSCDQSFFISLEGIEGAGKSSHISRLKDYLNNKGYDVIVIREPGGTTFGEKMRNAILQSEVPLHPLAEAHLFASSRAQLLHETILPKLAKPKTVVICDRYIDSSLAYQGKARNLGTETILQIHKDHPLNVLPHLTLYIKISLQTSYDRQDKRNAVKDYFESQNRQFYTNLIEGYDEASELFPDRIAVIDGEGTMDQVYSAIEKQIEKLISK